MVRHGDGIEKNGRSERGQRVAMTGEAGRWRSVAKRSVGRARHSRALAKPRIVKQRHDRANQR